jgi:hypothetical protein
MVDLDDLYGPMEVGDVLSTALGTETFADRDMALPGFDNTPGSSADTLPIEIFEHRRFLRVERSATLRSGQKVSKIWDHGTEYRALDTPHLPVASVGKIGNGKDSRRAYRSCGRP